MVGDEADASPPAVPQATSSPECGRKGARTMAERHLKPIEQRNLWEQIADRIRTSILSGELTPGTHLVTADLATRLGVSRGPVREALMALESSGIVVSTRRHGTIVGTPSTVDLEEVLSVREAIETCRGRSGVRDGRSCCAGRASRPRRAAPSDRGDVARR